VTGCHVFVDHTRTQPSLLIPVRKRPSGLKWPENIARSVPGTWTRGRCVATSRISIPTGVVSASSLPSGLSATSETENDGR
jgi:hypothetical protein